MNFIKGSVFGLVFAAQVAGAASADVVYKCKIEDQRVNRGWIPTTVIVSHKPGAAEATVNDNGIMYKFGKPITVPVKAETAERLSLSWQIKLPAERGGGYLLTYSLSVFKSKKTAQVRALVHGYSRTMQSQGTCEVMKS